MFKTARFASAMCWMCECLVFRRALHGKIYRELENEHFHEVLESLCLWPQTAATTTPHFKHLWNALDSECSARCPRWDKHRQLLLADCFYHLRLSRISRYNRTMLTIAGRSIDKLTPRELIQYLFYTNLQRRMVRNIKPIVEERLLSSSDSLRAWGSQVGSIHSGACNDTGNRT
ncbi:hypothetical protein HPB52_011822 [Rhipicephalus sanguineus]|uniref:Uncharacterized protein n=1 Tax=Rhipicephalus sanguineus TaxID=34632 RepID=A0A9D4PPJ8_RHISA|nr:hypothetical protein HPB52_011822 [Rhipicephalus sanguineus]